MRRGSRLATRRWHASTSRATSSTRSGTTPSLHTRHNTPHEALICACVLRKRRGLSRDFAAAEMRRNGTLIGAMLVRSGQVDGMLCGTFGVYATHLRYVEDVIGLKEDAHSFAAMSLLQLPRHTVFICDPYIHLGPTAEEIAEMTVLAAAELR